MALYIGAGTQTKLESIGIPLRLLGWVADHGYADDKADANRFLRRALYQSAPITHPEGNRRFGDLLLTVEDRTLVDLSVLEVKCSTCNDSKVFIAIDPDGTEREWPCPDCKIDKRAAGGHNRKLNKSRR